MARLDRQHGTNVVCDNADDRFTQNFNPIFCGVWISHYTRAEIAAPVTIDLDRSTSTWPTIGSGVLLHRQQQVYTVVTNAHVIQAASAPFQLRTHDGQIYATALIRPPTGQNRDLSILRFKTKRTYAVAKFAIASPKIGDRVWSAGFPIINDTDSEPTKAARRLNTVSGQITQILPIAISGGYKIGFDRAIRKGMSGGPMLDRSGELVGINGVHANPLWETPEILENGSTVSDALQKKINSSSWGIPIEYVRSYARL